MKVTLYRDTNIENCIFGLLSQKPNTQRVDVTKTFPYQNSEHNEIRIHLF